MATENLSVKGAIRSIPELESSILDRQAYDKVRRTYRAELRVINNGETRRFELRCEGVERYEHRVERHIDYGPDSYVDVTEVYHEPVPNGLTLVSLEIWDEAEWIEVVCESFEVKALAGLAPDQAI